MATERKSQDRPNPHFRIPVWSSPRACHELFSVLRPCFNAETQRFREGTLRVKPSLRNSARPCGLCVKINPLQYQEIKFATGSGTPARRTRSHPIQLKFFSLPAKWKATSPFHIPTYSGAPSPNSAFKKLPNEPISNPDAPLSLNHLCQSRLKPPEKTNPRLRLLNPCHATLTKITPVFENEFHTRRSPQRMR